MWKKLSGLHRDLTLTVLNTFGIYQNDDCTRSSRLTLMADHNKVLHLRVETDIAVKVEQFNITRGTTQYGIFTTQVAMQRIC